MATIGITGGIACGKSTVRRLLLDRIDADFFDTDACARQLLESDPEVRHRILEDVTDRAYSPSGAPDRAALRDIVFNDAAKKQTLEGILHPAIRQRWTRQASAATSRHRMFVVEIPLLYETRAENLFDHVLVVACAEARQIERLTTQRNLPPDFARKILASQWKLDLKVSRADHVVWNDGPLSLLASQVDLLASFLNSKYD